MTRDEKKQNDLSVRLLDRTVEWLWDSSSGSYVGYSSTAYVLMRIKYEDGLWRLTADDENETESIKLSILLESFDACADFAELVLQHVADIDTIKAHKEYNGIGESGESTE